MIVKLKKTEKFCTVEYEIVGFESSFLTEITPNDKKQILFKQKYKEKPA